MKRLCSYDKCGERRIHHESPDKMRPHRTIEVDDNYPESDPCFCSMTCAISAGWLVLAYEAENEQEERENKWLEKWRK